VFLAPTAVVIGDVVIGEGSSVWFGAVVRGDIHSIRIGRRVNVQDMVMIHVDSPNHPTRIADDVTLGHRAIVHGCTIEEGCLIGMGSAIMNGAVIGEGSLVAAGAVVTQDKSIPPGSLVAGIPGKVLRQLSGEEVGGLRRHAQHYAELAATYVKQGWGEKV
jgi:carbonic anhydrase/acetyltransferase-like protein (isoleucine patch superfamily)